MTAMIPWQIRLFVELAVDKGGGSVDVVEEFEFALMRLQKTLK
jgi:hypothetical protein